MLWVLKWNFLVRGFIWAPKTYVLIDGEENNDNLF